MKDDLDERERKINEEFIDKKKTLGLEVLSSIKTLYDTLPIDFKVRVNERFKLLFRRCSIDPNDFTYEDKEKYSDALLNDVEHMLNAWSEEKEDMYIVSHVWKMKQDWEKLKKEFDIITAVTMLNHLYTGFSAVYLSGVLERTIDAILENQDFTTLSLVKDKKEDTSES